MSLMERYVIGQLVLKNLAGSFLFHPVLQLGSVLVQLVASDQAILRLGLPCVVVLLVLCHPLVEPGLVGHVFSLQRVVT